MKYTIKQFNKDFPDDNACLEHILKEHLGATPKCPKCGNKGLRKVVKRKAYSCSRCAHQIYPLSGTIFYKSATPLKDWFHAMYLMAGSKNGVAAKELQGQLGCTYKTAWRMMHQIRSLMEQPGEKLSGVVEADETYIGGYRKGDTGGHRKASVLGVVQRGGGVRAKHVDEVHATSILKNLAENVEFGSQLYSDEYSSYKKAKRLGIFHEAVNHSRHEFARGPVSTNTIEGFWGQMKRSMDGTYHAVSRKHLQKYLDEFSWRYSQRHSEIPAFVLLLNSVCGRPSSPGQRSSVFPVAVA